MGQDSALKSPKKEEHLVPDSVIADFFGSNTGDLADLKGGLGIRHGKTEAEGHASNCNTYDQIDWDCLMEWDGLSISEEVQDSGVGDRAKSGGREGNMVNLLGSIKREICGVWEGDDEEDGDEKKPSLNLSLNYQEVMDAWSDRGPCRADGFGRSTSNHNYMGEVPMLEEDRTKREASVLKYREKRQNRLFSKKIRYQVRKLNADKRPRLKGRFVRRVG